jgi:hypothetical protein
MPHPKSILLQILVTVNSDGSFTPTIFSYFDGPPALDPKKALHVNVGDRIGWIVQVIMPSGRKSLPYTLGFANESFFGVSEIDEPLGGASPFLTVLALQDKCSYTLNITGVGCVFDPDIQSGSDSLDPGALTITAYQVTWDAAANTITWTSSATPAPQPFPMQVAHGDKVTFRALVAVGVVSNFQMTFENNINSWATPFDANNRVLSAPAGSDTTGQKPVDAPPSPGASFPFAATINVNGAPLPPSPTYAITM